MTQTMPTLADLLPLLPELVLAGAAFALLLLDLFLNDRQRVLTHVLAVATLALSASWSPLAGAGRARCSPACSCATTWPTC